MFIDRVIVRVAAGTGGSGICVVPPREVRPAGRARRRRRRPRRRRHRARRHQPRHAARLHLPRLVGGGARRARQRARTRPARSGDDIVLPVPPGTIVRDHRHRRDPRRGARERRRVRRRPAAAAAERATRWFATSVHRSAARVAARRGRRERDARARAQAHRRRRARRPAERRQVHAALGHLAPRAPRSPTIRSPRSRPTSASCS